LTQLRTVHLLWMHTSRAYGVLLVGQLPGMLLPWLLRLWSVDAALMGAGPIAAAIAVAAAPVDAAVKGAAPMVSAAPVAAARFYGC
jgi:hypothetical protein